MASYLVTELPSIASLPKDVGVCSFEMMSNVIPEASVEVVHRLEKLRAGDIIYHLGSKGLVQYMLHPAKLYPEGTGLMSLGVRELDINNRGANCLLAENIQTVGQLVQRTSRELSGFPNIGPKTLKEIQEALAKRGLALRS